MTGVDRKFSKLKLRQEAKKWGKNWPLYVLLVPSLIYLAVFCYAPMYGVIIAFKNYNSYLGIVGSPWTGYGGLEHFLSFVTHSDFWRLLRNTLVISVWSILTTMPLPIILALIINEVTNKRFRKAVQTISYAPYFVSLMVVVGMCFSFTNSESGIINKIFGTEIPYMNRQEWFVPIYLLSSLWQGMGWWAIIYVGTLSNVDPALHEAAKIDGASRYKRIIHINIPSIMPIATIMFIMSLGNMLSVGFDKIFLMQTPLNKEVSDVISTYVYTQALLGGSRYYSYGSAIGLFNTAINLILLFAANFMSKKVGGETLW